MAYIGYRSMKSPDNDDGIHQLVGEMCREQGTQGDHGIISILRGMYTTSSVIVVQSEVISRSYIDFSLPLLLSSADAVLSNAILRRNCVALVSHREA